MRRTPPNPARPRRARGSILVYFLVLVSVLATGLITTMALVTGGHAQVAGQTLKRDQSFYLAEAGLQHALWKVGNSTWAASGYPAYARTLANGSYAVSVTGNDGFGQLRVTSTGTILNTSPPVSSTVSCTLGGAYPLPAVQLGGNFSGGGGNYIAGALMASGSISQHGNFTVSNGNVYAGGAIATGISLDPGFAKYPSAPVPPAPDVLTIANALKTSPGAFTITNPDALDFRKSSNGVLVYTGPINNWRDPVITGAGTLVVFGDVTTKSMRSLAGHNVNLVIVGDFTVGGGSKFDLAGSLYVSQDIDSQSQFNVQGVILANGNLSTQGQGSDITRLPPPWFDPRLTAPLGGRRVTMFTGPIF